VRSVLRLLVTPRVPVVALPYPHTLPYLRRPLLHVAWWRSQLHATPVFSTWRRCRLHSASVSATCYRWRRRLLQGVAAVAINQAPPCCKEAGELRGGATTGQRRSYVQPAAMLQAQGVVLHEKDRAAAEMTAVLVAAMLPVGRRC
jgi:hypothetical protein